MPRVTADDTVTIRVPKGTADKLRAATGQPFSRLMRWIAMALLEQYTAEGRTQLTDEGRDVGDRVRGILGEQNNGQ